MSVRPAGITSFLTNTAATAFPQIELTPGTARNIQVTEFGVSCNAAPDSVLVPSQWAIERMSVAGTGGLAQNPAKLIFDTTAALATTSKVHGGTPFTADGTLQDSLHRFFVPNVSGMIWVAAPGRSFDCDDSDDIHLDLPIALGSGIAAATYIVFEE